jgi:ATPase family associated with various cellular activities (AAA)
MDVVELLDRTLSRPPSAIAWSMNRELAKLRPGKALLVTDESAFDVDDYERAGLCHRHALVAAPLLETERDEQYRAIYRVVTGWHAVEWRAEALELVTISFYLDSYRARMQWVIADSPKLAEAFFEEVCSWNDTPRARLLVYQHGEFRKSAELYDQIQRTTFDALLLPGRLKEEIRADVARFFGAKATYDEYGVPWKRGLLLIGPPGNGKTHTLRALIRESGQPCLYVKDFKGPDSTETHNISAAFARARAMSPCVLVLEDIDCHIDDDNRSVLLNELDGFAANQGLLVVATTNHPEKLDRSILDRPSRFDRKFHFPMPTPAERRAYLAQWNNRLKAALRATDPVLDLVAERSRNFSFAYLKELTLASTMAFIEEPRPGGMDELLPRTFEALRNEMDSTNVVLPPTPSGRVIGVKLGPEA